MSEVYECILCRKRAYTAIGIRFTLDYELIESKPEDTDCHVCVGCAKGIAKIVAEREEEEG